MATFSPVLNLLSLTIMRLCQQFIQGYVETKNVREIFRVLFKWFMQNFLNSISFSERNILASPGSGMPLNSFSFIWSHTYAKRCPLHSIPSPEQSRVPKQKQTFSEFLNVNSDWRIQQEDGHTKSSWDCSPYSDYFSGHKSAPHPVFSARFLSDDNSQLVWYLLLE